MDATTHAGVDVRDGSALEPSLWNVDRTCHELRRPVAVISGYAELLADGLAGELSPDQADHVEHIQRNVARLNRTIVDLAQLGSIALSPVPDELEDAQRLLESIVAEQGPVFASCGASLSLSIAPPLPDVLLNATAVRGALERLLEHVLRFTPRGASLVLHVYALDDIVHLELTDPGPALSDEEVERSFDYLYRPERVRGGDDPGGAALTLCRAWIERVGGRVRAIRLAEEDTTYRIELAAEART